MEHYKWAPLVKATHPATLQGQAWIVLRRVPKGTTYKGTIRAPEDLLKFSLVFLRDLSWDLCSSLCLLTTYLMQLPTLKYLLSVDDTNIYLAIKSPGGCNLLQSDITSIKDLVIFIDTNLYFHNHVTMFFFSLY